ncbi:MAG: ABC transporter substrate-binding protein [Conexivisphaera sp.]
MRRSAISRTALWAIVAVVIIVVVVGGVAAYYATRPPPPKPTPTPTPTRAIVGQVNLGVATDLSGAYGALGEQVLWGAQLAASHINAQGGIYLANGPNGPGNYTVNVVWTDDQTNPSVGPEALLQLYTTYHPVAVIGSIATIVVDAELPVIQQNKIVYLSQAAQTITLTVSQNFTPLLDHSTIFHDEDTAYYFGWLTVEFLLNYKDQISPSGPLRVGAVTYSNNPVFMQEEMGGIDAAIKYYGAQGEIQIVDVESVPSPASTQLQPTLTKFAQGNVNVIITGLTPPSATALVQQAVDFPQLKGVTTILWTPEDDPAWYATLGPSANYLNLFVFSNFPSMSNVSVQSINERWQHYRNEYLAYTGKPLSAVGSFGIDNAYIVAAGLQLAGSTNSSALASALESLKIPQIPWPLANVYTPFQPGGTIFGPVSSGVFWHSTNQTIVFMQVHYNPTTKKVYTEVVWPSQYATSQATFGG